MKYAFVRAHREEFGVRAMCWMLRVQPSGFYAWLREPICARAKEDARQTMLIREAWSDSGKVYGYRKLHDDLRDQGEVCSPNRVARLASLAGIAAQIGYRRHPGRYGGKPAIVAENKLDRQFEVDAPDQTCGCPLLRHWFEPNGRRHHVQPDPRRLAVSVRRDRPVFAPRCRIPA